MSFNKEQFRELVDDMLLDLAQRTEEPRLYSADAVELLMMTAAQETLLGTYLKQRQGGHALGVFQMEPATYKDLLSWLYHKHPKLREVVVKYQSPGLSDEEMLTGNLPFQIVIARLYYWRFAAPLPKFDDIEGMAMYYKMYWNTKLGAARVKRVIKNYRKYAL